MKFTKASVAALQLPDGKTDFIAFDSETGGFGVRLRASGKRTWVAQLRVAGRTRRLSIGSVGRIELEAARTAARRFFAEAILGADPIAARAEARARAAITVGSTVEAYLAAREDSLRASSFEQACRCLRRYFKQLHDLPVSAVTRAHVAKAVNEIASTRGKVSAARARSHLSSFFSWALKEGLGGESNPVTYTNDPAPDERPRDRVLSPSEIRAIWQLLPDVEFGRVMKLLFLTGCRRAEIGSLEWSEVDLDRASLAIRAERMKSGKAHKLPLVPEALEILSSVARRPGNKFVFGAARQGFTGFSLPMNELRGALAATGDVVEHWSAHDIRRTVKSELSELEVAPWVSERILAHTRGGIEGVYDWSKLERPMRQALTLWAERLDRIISDDADQSNVVALHA
jgi:integrase